MKVVFHGSESRFDSFSYENVGENGTNEGFGFYFTDAKQIAKSYSSPHGKKGYIYTVSFLGKKQFSNEKITFSKTNVKKLLKTIDKDGLGFLSNYGYVKDAGYNRLLEIAAQELLYCSQDDVEIMGSLINSGAGSMEYLFKVAYELFGYDSIIQKANWGTIPHQIYIATVHEAYEIISVEEN